MTTHMVILSFLAGTCRVATWSVLAFFCLSSNALGADGGILANTDALFDLCMQRCDEPTRLGALTKKGCEAGCYEARRGFSLRGREFKDYERCAKKIDEIELQRDVLIEEHQDWCLENFTHLHDRKGCKDAMEVFYTRANRETVCQRRVASRGAGGQPAGVVALPEVKDTPKYQKPVPAQKANAMVKQPQVVKKPSPAKGGASPKAAGPVKSGPAKPAGQKVPSPAVQAKVNATVVPAQNATSGKPVARNATKPLPEKDAPYTPPPVELDLPKPQPASTTNKSSSAPIGAIEQTKTNAVLSHSAVPPQVPSSVPPSTKPPVVQSAALQGVVPEVAVTAPQLSKPPPAPLSVEKDTPKIASPAPVAPVAIPEAAPPAVVASPTAPAMPVAPVVTPQPDPTAARPAPRVASPAAAATPDAVVLPDGVPLPALPFESPPQAETALVAPVVAPPEDPVAPALVLTPLPPPVEGGVQGRTVQLPALQEPRPAGERAQ